VSQGPQGGRAGLAGAVPWPVCRHTARLVRSVNLRRRRNDGGRSPAVKAQCCRGSQGTTLQGGAVIALYVALGSATAALDRRGKPRGLGAPRFVPPEVTGPGGSAVLG
jgi:hypothetical protein